MFLSTYESCILLYNSYNNKIVIPSILVVLVSLFTIISKYLLAHYITRKGKEYKNNKGRFLIVRSDLYCFIISGMIRNVRGPTENRTRIKGLGNLRSIHLTTGPTQLQR